MIRVVLDTNIIVSAVLRPGGVPETAFNLTFDEKTQLCISNQILAEYEDVLRRPHLALDADNVDLALKRIRKAAYVVSPTKVVSVCRDPDDNIFLECADAAEADYLVTGNQRHFPDRWKKTRIISARELIELLVKQQE